MITLDPAERERLSPVALKSFSAIAARWRLTPTEAAALLDMSEETWAVLQAEPQPLTEDQLTRVSALIGLHSGLAETFSEDLATRWPRLKNAGPIFRNRTPIDAMIEDGTPTILDARRLIEAVSGGL